MIAIALLILLDVPRPDPHVWLDLRRVVKLSPRLFQVASGDRPDSMPADRPALKTWWGITTLMSEAGVEVALTQQASLDHPLSVGMAVDLGRVIN